MNENINLCEILKGCEGIELYSIIHGPIIIKEVREKTLVFYPLSRSSEIIYVGVSGLWSDNYPGECIILPSKDQRDWSKFKRPIPFEAPMMCSMNSTALSFHLRYYKDKRDDRHFCFDDGYKNNTKFKASSRDWDIMIPYDKFNPLNIEESLKYNIQKQ